MKAFIPRSDNKKRKLEAIKPLIEQGLSDAQIGKILGTSRQLITYWREKIKHEN